MSSEADNDKLSRLLEACLIQMSASNEWLERRILPLSVDQLRWSPRSRCWSIAACLDHLNRTLEHYLPKISDALAKGGEMKNRDYQSEFAASEEAFLRTMEPPILFAMSAPTALLPASAIDPDQIVEQFPHLRNRLVKVVRSIEDFDVLGASIPDSVHPPVQSLGGVIALLAAHERRHLWQAQQISTAPDFPANFASGPTPDDRKGR